MDGIQPYAGANRLPTSHQNVQTVHATPSATKTPSDYLRALRRRTWLVLAIAMPLIILGAIWTARMPNVYMAKTQILIEPPRFDDVLGALVGNDIVRSDPQAMTNYVPNRIAMLRNKVLAEKVVNDPALTQGGPASPDAAEDLVTSVVTRQITGTSQFTVSLEGTDAPRITKLLTLLLEAFQDQAKMEVVGKMDDSKRYAEDSLKSLKFELTKMNGTIQKVLKNSQTVGPGGTNLKQHQFETMTTLLLNEHSRLGELQQQAWISQSFPNLHAEPDSHSLEGKISELELMREELTGRMKQLRRRVRYFDTDPSVLTLSAKLQTVMDRLTHLRSIPDPDDARTDPYEVLLQSKRSEIRAKEDAAKALLVELQDSMPEHQRFLDLIDEQKRYVERIAVMATKLSDFDIVSRSRRDPVTILAAVAEPSGPIRPKRTLNLAIVVFLSVSLGIGLVCLLEHIDHTVKAPEQLTAGLTLPLFGVVPRMRRTALIHRGGHLWTPGAPDSIEADAYRNLRASLVGLTDKRGPIVTLLVTSAKAGEGKSTTALNLAATCARAGERTLLMDVDLRRPSLGNVFQEQEDDGPPLGLVDVLRGDLPWQRTVVRTDILNLDFLPTGDTRGVPIEILGSLELRQLLIGLSNHYDRVILDGPAILGLADCRMLGRVVDSALLVVRSGSQELRPLQHAKAMLEQSHVSIAGVVFNGLYEDLKNWSSYGPDTPYGYTEWDGSTRTGRSAGGLTAPADDHAALPMAGSVQS